MYEDGGMVEVCGKSTASSICGSTYSSRECSTDHT